MIRVTGVWSFVQSLENGLAPIMTQTIVQTNDEGWWHYRSLGYDRLYKV